MCIWNERLNTPIVCHRGSSEKQSSMRRTTTTSHSWCMYVLNWTWFFDTHPSIAKIQECDLALLVTSRRLLHSSDKLCLLDKYWCYMVYINKMNWKESDSNIVRSWTKMKKHWTCDVKMIVWNEWYLYFMDFKMNK